MMCTSSQLESAIDYWFQRRVGSWVSERRYLFNPAEPKPVNMTTKFNVSKKASKVVVDWTGQTSGTMDLVINGTTLERSRDYFGSGSHDSTMSMIDEDTLLLHTHYDGTIFREEIRLLKSDRIALRQTIGFSDTTSETLIIGQYAESRSS